ncbi:hypothetical protein DND36_33490 [Pseudomonas savastanoi pv. glycinea]|nr:hypothetical protein DND36_33490 [Pseudomonas savastanoi pv. glycinea]RMU57596.1 putative Resolvase [Pseudomonas savastanoi pv. glycinea]
MPLAVAAISKIQSRRLRPSPIRGRPVDAELRNRVRELLAAGLGIRAVARHAACSCIGISKCLCIRLTL